MDRATRLEGLDGPRRTGALASVVKSAVALHGVTVLVPEADEPYDFAADVGGLLRVAVRAARRVTPAVARFETHAGGPEGVDAYGVYAPGPDDCYLVPAAEATAGSMALRFDGDADYALDRQLAALGGWET
jgi:hypothetical protein